MCSEEGVSKQSGIRAFIRGGTKMIISFRGRERRAVCVVKEGTNLKRKRKSSGHF